MLYISIIFYTAYLCVIIAAFVLLWF